MHTTAPKNHYTVQAVPPCVETTHDMHNHLFYGDNIDALRHMKDEGVDPLLHCPPFNSNRSYNKIYHNVGSDDLAQARAFVDTWQWDDEGVLVMNKRGVKRCSASTARGDPLLLACAQPLDTAQALALFDAKPERPLTGRVSQLGVPVKSRGLP